MSALYLAAGEAPRVAVVGTGMVARVHVDAARSAGAHVIGVLGSRPERSDEAARAWRVPTAYPDLAALLEDRPDVVHVCTPNATHAPYVRAVLAAGAHVVCEKPLGTTAEEADDLVRLADEAGVVAAVPFVYRYHPMVREIRARRASGELGELLMVHGSYLQDWMLDPRVSGWRVDASLGGPSRAFADIGSHWCDLMEFVSGETVAEISAVSMIAHPTRPAGRGLSFASPGQTGGSDHRITTEDAMVATFRTARGIIANVVVSQVAAGRKNRLWIELDGTDSSAVFDQEDAETAWFGALDGARVVRRGDGAASDEQRRLNLLPAGHAQGWAGAFAAFAADVYEAVRGGDPAGLPTFADAAHSAHIVDAALRSAADGRWAPIGPREPGEDLA